MCKPGCLAITNSTGVYFGVPSDPTGIAQFLTLFPGHYQGQHAGGNVTHVGQPFSREALRAAVELAAPYNINMQEVPADENDMWAPSLADGGYDPFL
ncbi:hypothetical protein L873DRAFT_1799047 [Choiromyces venosus 120613-1]|uniref:Uncharacterized protein n=1 Tax=Choiromyces venosus 120613-1 TaxID=1336337 RepID=A0A3N4K294_9PEZI|nr:hypothetical protein L873DRAFT_1799047 [Choiromyces venosus 120613-1]